MKLVVAMLWATTLAAQPANPDLPHLLQHLRSEIRPAEAMLYMRAVYRSDRYFTFPQFQKTAAYLRTTLQNAGVQDLELVDAPADGVTQVGFWTMPLAWDARSARLEIEGSGVVLADYAKIPSSLGMWSGPTAPGGISAEVVEWKPSGVTPNSLRNKLVLTSENPANIKWLLVQAGALGAINTFTENPGLRDGRQWINAWGDNGWAYLKTSTPLLSFSISPNQADLVRKLLAQGPVRVKASVDTRYYSGSYPYVTGVIRGTGQEEVLTLGHTSEQGAEDNATGVAATVEALSALNRLISAGKLPRPKRSIRILSMGEMYGSMHYVEHNRERVRNTVAAMCVDTPAASYDLPGTEYTFYMNPHVAKDFTDAFILKIAGEYFPGVHRPWHEKPFTTGTDTYLAEPMVNIPTVWGYSGSGVETHHNSEDTPDRVDSRSLRDITTVNAAFLYFVANAGAPEALWLAKQSEARARRLIAADSDPGHGAYLVDREKQSVLSVLRLVPESERAALRGQLSSLVEGLEQLRPAGTGAPAEGSQIVVRRKRFGTIPLDDLPHRDWEGQPSGAWAAIPTIALYWCDGKRNLAEVARLTRYELGPTDFDFVRYFKFLQKHGYVDLQNESRKEN